MRIAGVVASARTLAFRIYLFIFVVCINTQKQQQAFIRDLGITGIGGTVWCVSTDCSLDFNGQNKYYTFDGANACSRNERNNQIIKTNARHRFVFSVSLYTGSEGMRRALLQRDEMSTASRFHNSTHARPMQYGALARNSEEEIALKASVDAGREREEECVKCTLRTRN